MMANFIRDNFYLAIDNDLQEEKIRKEDLRKLLQYSIDGAIDASEFFNDVVDAAKSSLEEELYEFYGGDCALYVEERGKGITIYGINIVIKPIADIKQFDGVITKKFLDTKPQT